MDTNQRTVETRATPETLWRLWSDTSTWAEWNPDVSAAQLDGPFATGTTGTMTTKQGTRPFRIVTVDPGRSFQLEAAPLPFTRFTFTCMIAPGEGTTSISQAVAMGGPLGPVVSLMMSGSVVGSFENILRGLAAKAESADQISTSTPDQTATSPAAASEAAEAEMPSIASHVPEAASEVAAPEAMAAVEAHTETAAPAVEAHAEAATTDEQVPAEGS